MRRISTALTALTIVALLLTVQGCPRQAGDQDNRGSTLAPRYKDGKFVGASFTDEHGYATAEVTISNDTITDVTLREITEKGRVKNYDTYPYAPAREANEEMPGRFREANSDQVDIVSGATNSSVKYMTAVRRALLKAENNPRFSGGTYFDGIYQGESESDQFGNEVAVIKIVDDKIAEVELKGFDAEGNEIDFETYEHEPVRQAFREMPERFKEKNSADVDVVSGATNTSNKWKDAVAKALENARTPQGD